MKNLQRILIFFVFGSIIGCSKNNEGYKPEPFPFQDEETGKWGFVDLRGKVIIEPRFETQPSYFKEGTAIIESESGYDYIDLHGDTLGSDFLTASLFEEGMAFVTRESGERCFIRNDFSEAFCLDNLSQKVQSCGTFSEGLARFQSGDNNWGYLNTSGEVIIEPVYTKALNFREDYAYVEVREAGTAGIKKMFIDKTGNIKINFDKNIMEVRSFSEGLAAVKDTSGWGFIDKTGTAIIGPFSDWSAVTNFNNGFAAFREREEWGMINKKGKRILGSSYDIPPVFFNDLATVEEDNGMGFINKKGRKKIESKFKEVVYPFFRGRAVVKEGKYYIIIMKNGKISGNRELVTIDKSYGEKVLQGIQGYSQEEILSEYSYFRKIDMDNKYAFKGQYPIDKKTAMTTSCYHFIRDDFNNVIGIEYLVKGEAGSKDPLFGCSKISVEYQDTIEKRKFLDKNDRQIKNKDNIYAEGLLLNKQKQRVAKLNLDLDGDMIKDKNGVAKYTWELDKDGTRVKETMLDLNNEIIQIGSIYSKKFVWDKTGNLTELHFLDSDGELVANDNGIAVQKWKYDKFGNQIAVEYYNKNGQLEDDSNGMAVMRYEYDRIGRIIRIDFFDRENNKTPLSGYKIATVLREYDDENDKVDVTYLDVDGNEIDL